MRCTETHRELRTMYHLMNNLPVLGTLGVAAMLAGPLARLPIDLGAWYSNAGPVDVRDRAPELTQRSARSVTAHGQGVTIMEAMFAGFLIF